MFKIILTVDSNWAIGVNGKLLFQIPEDMKYFKELTENNVVIMGRKTFSSLGNKPLPNRINIVLTRNENFKSKYENVIVCHNIEEILKITVSPWSWGHFASKDIFVIGGAEIIKELFPYCGEAYITYIDYPYPDPDTFFPIPINTLDNWKLISEERGMNCDNCGVDYYFRIYKKRFNPKLFTFNNTIKTIKESQNFLGKMFQETLFGNKDSKEET